jgi:autotransporter-associated beta strand protein
VNGTARVLFDVNGAVPTGSALTVNGSALFQAASTIGSLAGAGAVFMHGNNTLTVGGDDTSTTFSGVYQDSGGSAALTKTGTGTLTLSGTNTYTGATTVNAGTLAVNGSLDSPVTVLSSGTLAPGLSTGIIETGDLTLDSGSTLDIELNGPTVGTEYDQVDVTGTVNLGGATLNVVLGFTPSPGDVFTIINNDGTDAVSGTFAGLAEGATLSVDGSLFTLSYAGGDGNDVTLTAFDAVTPFATFTVQKLHIKLPPHIDDAFDLQARFTLGADSNGIAPLTEQVELALTGGTGAFTVTIPAGAFQQKKQGPFTFKGSIDDVELNVKITRIGGAVYKFEVKGDHADLTGLANPVTVTLTIGGDSGSTTVQARIKSPH